MFFTKKSITCNLQDDISLSTPIEELTFTVFDTEATGFQVGSTDRLIEIGAVQVKGLEVREVDKFHTYVNPKRQISREIMELTGISNENVEGAPESLEAILSFFQFVEAHGSSCLVGHYLSFDLLLLKSELKRYKLGLKKPKTIDTLDFIGYIAPSYDMRDLERYAMAFGTRIYERHSAIGDALTTAYLFVELLWQFKNRGSCTWGELLKATDSQARNIMY
ncbi:3'-5' exoribonuclease [Bacillus luteolus]|uniref:3'-5' exoribonuclease n=1 Tax=Litchfieldia luteola TaxID=682179 RepID=A0ABR9QFK7_9BACI|nr:exonuclease domain-containing protein [Cytobacillus luteolus]MBE4907281.1 3'-5' exoribonuclease [Cytobacillus luteolus]MBP1943238.1 DNA polymerase-3 subunit epsilon [Cytobacillus luteolus]